ncbi:MAG: hypothetical protein EOP54_19460 [Sphingobacteriales bacterium]|nr:MAG: hypothetical protein EOP54_19460 [Sphingobacteriales bacterium]
MISQVEITASLQHTIEERESRKNGNPVYVFERDKVKTIGLTASVLSRITNRWSAVSGIESYADRVRSNLAQKLGGDDYGMKAYVLVILKSGTNTTGDSATVETAFRGHMANMGRLVKEGKLVVAGPLKKNDKNYRGIFILNVPTVEEAEKLVQTDPAIIAKFLDVELYSWYGSAALPEHLKFHDKIEKKNF